MPKLIAGRIIAEFVDGRDARAFYMLKPAARTVTAGINHPFAVRDLVEAVIAECKHGRALEDNDCPQCMAEASAGGWCTGCGSAVDSAEHLATCPGEAPEIIRRSSHDRS